MADGIARTAFVLLAACILSAPGEASTRREGAQATAVDGPAPSHLEAVAFDAARRRLVLFGGSRRDRDSAWVDSNDTWEWDGARWRLATSSSGDPGARRGHALAYDPAERRVVLAGGVRTRAGENGDEALDDTWTYDGRHWARGPALPVMSGHALVYAARERAMLLLGNAGREAEQPRRLVIWRRTADGWTFADSTGPRTVGLVRAAYDVKRSVLVVPVLHGPTPRVWEWDGERWRDLDAPGPGRRSRHAVAYESRTGRVVIVGGRDDASRTLLGDAWTWDGASWSPLPTGASMPEPRASASLVADADSSRLLLFGGLSRTRGLVADVWVWSPAGWSHSSPAAGAATRTSLAPSRQRLALAAARTLPVRSR